jgi:hypothetical protein
MGRWRYRWRCVVSFTPSEESSYTQWVDLTVVMDAVEKRKISYPCRELNPVTAVVQLVT